MSNVKAGDIAIVVRSAESKNVGKICEVVSAESAERWRVRFPCAVEWSSGRWEREGSVRDVWLRPLRDKPGEDETLTWAGHPKTAEIRKGVEMLEKAVDRLQRMADELQKGRV